MSGATMPKMTHEEALRLLLDQVDYTSGACEPVELVAAVLPLAVIERCKQALEPHPIAERELKELGS